LVKVPDLILSFTNLKPLSLAQIFDPLCINNLKINMKVFNNRYKVIKVIGQGAYGEINLAEDVKYRRVGKQMGEENDKVKLEL
jgi:serine/threonine protein kinase